MTIKWFGQSFFKITVKNQKNENITIAIDPYGKGYGLKVPTKFGADIALVTHDHGDHNNLEIIKGTQLSPEPFIISGPGEYEVKGIMIYGIPAYHDDQQGAERGENTIYLINAENMWFAHLGDLGQKSLTAEQLEQLEDIDLVFIPTGGTFTINAKEASSIISQIEPRVIIPMHYKIPQLNLKLDNVDKFIKEIGIKPETTDKLNIKSKDLPQENTRLFVLSPTN